MNLMQSIPFPESKHAPVEESATEADVRLTKSYMYKDSYIYVYSFLDDTSTSK